MNNSKSMSISHILDDKNIQSKLQVLPAGIVSYFASSAPPPQGWLLCNGALISRTIYSDLFNAIGVTYGSGDGSTTFGIPDLRGEFLRGLDNGRGIDVDRTLGSVQGDAIRNLTGGFWTYTYIDGWPTGVFKSYEIHKQQATGNNIPGGDRYVHAGLAFDASLQVPTANENRPRNVALSIYIKY